MKLFAHSDNFISSSAQSNFDICNANAIHPALTLPQLMYSTAVSRKKKNT